VPDRPWGLKRTRVSELDPRTVAFIEDALAMVRDRLHGELQLVMLCGSHADGTASSRSDVDILVACDIGGIDRLRVTRGGLTADIFRESVASVAQTLVDHRREHIVSMLARAVVVDDRLGLANRFSSAARAALARPPSTHTPARRFAVSERLRDLANELQRPAKSKPEAILLVCTAIDVLIDAILLKHGLWTVKRRHLLSMLFGTVPDAAADLVAATLAPDLPTVARILSKYVERHDDTRQKLRPEDPL
jgi:hypothetical protein